jgi:uncharacterized membrane protein
MLMNMRIVDVILAGFAENRCVGSAKGRQLRFSKVACLLIVGTFAEVTGFGESDVAFTRI